MTSHGAPHGDPHPAIPRLMAITDRRALGARRLEDWLDELAGAGVDALQIREKDLPDSALYELVRRARAHLPRSMTVLVNGRLDVALAAGADGVHLPADGLPAQALRRWAEARGATVLIGRSTHSEAAARAARKDGVDYVTFGPVFPTPSKAAYGPPPGPEGLRRAVAVGIPVLALGGIDADALAAVAAAGAAGAAGIRVFLSPEALDRFARRGRDLFRDRRPPCVVNSRDRPKP